MKLDCRLDHAAVPVGAPNLVHILLTITAPEQPTGSKRPDLNIAVVLDRSGSMGGDKLEYAKKSVLVLLNHLGPRDRFSLVAFDDEVLPLVEGVRGGDKTQVAQTVEGIVTGGSTNLSGGWLKGIELAGREATAEQVNAVLLLTDGQANAGITEPAQLMSLGESVLKDKSVRTSCLGVGSNFSEDLLKGIAAAAGGRFYYIESPDHAPEIFAEELGGLLAVVAQNTELSLKFADGVTGVAQLTGYSWKLTGASARLILGDFHAGQVKHALLVAQLPALTDVADMHLAEVSLSYAEMSEGAIELKRQKQNLVVQVVETVVAVPGDPEVLMHIGLQQAAQARRDAVAELDKGDIAGATRVLERNRDCLRKMASQAKSPERLKVEADELDRRVKELREQGDIGGTRKFMVSEGTNISMGNYNQAQSARLRRSRPKPTPGSTGTKA